MPSMSTWKFAALAAVAARSVDAAPAATGSNISSSCTNIEFSNNQWLVADCLTSAGSSSRIQSSVFLESKITNDDGTLKWKVDGNYLSSCNSCSLSDAKLTCTCQRAAGHTLTTTLDLEEHIANYNGYLLSDLSGAPSIPTTPSSISFPADLSWSLRFGNTSCFSPDGGCSGLNVGNPGTCGSNSFTAGPSTEPTSCYAVLLPITGHIYQAFGQLQASFPSEAWRIEAYEDVDCTKLVGNVEGAEQGTCKTLGATAVAVKAVPLWNADV